MQHFRLKPKPGWSRSAFTLVEMLVVIAIILILMTAGTIGLSGVGGKGVTSGVGSAESLFDEARTTAVGKNLRSCVLVAKTLTNNTSDDLRRILVAYEETDPATGQPKQTDPNVTPNWVLSSRGALLPDQTFFSQTLSKLDQIGGTGDIATINSSKIVGVKPAYQGDYYIYEFNSQGICKTPGCSFVIGSGARTLTKASTAQLPRVMASSRRDFGGFVIWRNGSTSVFHSPDQISKNLPATGSTF